MNLAVKYPPESSVAFHQGMCARMDVSYCKYGALTDAYPDKVDAIANLESRLAKYKADGNTEWLMDVANFAMIEYMRPRHPKAHFAADTRSPGRVWVGEIDKSQRRNRAEEWVVKE